MAEWLAEMGTFLLQTTLVMLAAGLLVLSTGVPRSRLGRSDEFLQLRELFVGEAIL